MTDELEALVLADAAGALDEAERADLQVRLAALPADERDRVAALYDTTLALAGGVDLHDPPAHVRDRVLAAARQPVQYTVTAREGWGDSGVPGISAKILALDEARGVVTMLMHGAAGAVFPSHHHSGPEECYVVRGSIAIGSLVLRAGDFHHADPDSDHDQIVVLEEAEVMLVAAAEDYL